MRCLMTWLALFPLLSSSLFAIDPPSIPRNPVLVAKNASAYPALHARRTNKRLRKYLKKIFASTKKAAQRSYNVAGNRVVLDKKVVRKMQRRTRVIHHPDRIRTGQKAFATQIMVTRREILSAAREHASQGIPTAALNMAHENRAGDNVFWGKQTAEAAIFRSTNIYLSLIPHLNPTLKRQLKDGTYHVPEFGGIYSPSVFLFRETQDGNFRFLAKPLEIAVISSVPYNMCHHSSHHSSPGSRGKYVHGTKEKIRAILRIAARKGHLAVVLSDYGCEERHNHPKVVSRLFKEVLLESEFEGVFKVVDFAIPAAATTQLFLDFSRELNGLRQ